MDHEASANTLNQEFNVYLSMYKQYFSNLNGQGEKILAPKPS